MYIYTYIHIYIYIYLHIIILGFLLCLISMCRMDRSEKFFFSSLSPPPPLEHFLFAIHCKFILGMCKCRKFYRKLILGVRKRHLFRMT